MKIVDIQLIPLQIPQTYETHWANGRISVAEHTLIKIIAEDGTYGISEAVPRTGIYGETQQSILTVLRKMILPPLIGLDSMDLETIWEKMNETPYNFVAKGSVDVALYDLNGKILGVPTAALLGGPYRREVPLCWVSGGSWFPKDYIMEETKRIMDEGYKGIKMKAGHWREDIALAQEMISKSTLIPTSSTPGRSSSASATSCGASLMPLRSLSRFGTTWPVPSLLSGSLRLRCSPTRAHSRCLIPTGR